MGLSVGTTRLYCHQEHARKVLACSVHNVAHISQLVLRVRACESSKLCAAQYMSSIDAMTELNYTDVILIL